jgi:hypothetical protein
MTDLIKEKYAQRPRRWPYYLVIFAIVAGIFVWSMTVMNMSGMSEKRHCDCREYLQRDFPSRLEIPLCT